MISSMSVIVCTYLQPFLHYTSQ